MTISVKFFQSYELFQGRSATNIQFLAYDEFIVLGELELIVECSLGSFVINGQETDQKKLSCQTDGIGEASVSIVGPDVGGDGQLTVFLQENGRQIAVQSYHFTATAHYTLNFNVITDYAMADGVQSNKVKAILTGTGSGVNLAKRQLDLSVTGSASFEKGSQVQAISVTTDISGNASFKLYDTNKEGETVTLTGFLDASKTAHAIEPIHFQRNLDCETSPPADGKYIRTIFTYSINNQQYLFRQRKCDHLVTVHKLVSGGKMGEQVSTGQKWVNFYDLIFPFILGEEQYIFGLAKDFINTSKNTPKSYWIIVKLDEKGEKTVVDSGYWDSAYDVGFAYAIGSSQFIYLHSKDKDKDKNERYPCIIRKILPNGKMGDITDEFTLDSFYEATFFFSMEEQTYLYVHTSIDRSAYTYKLNGDGRMGELVSSNTWSHFYCPQFTYSIGKKYYFTGQSLYNNLWFISYIYSGGLPEAADEQINSWDTGYQYQVPFSIDGHQYFIRQDQSKNHWYITELLNNAKMGNDTDSSDNP
ncbi:Ig-like domain-containing protein [Xenorhabdus sp. IM139775]|uniref:Ig-like domain-containing protein n=1 Tax=Xenorhabdus sp. IM139775 TaxID=3025876 RepID=UPI00235A0FB2|nr:Ig-like domain-containing protein [Xenorhabdus sp. IM139775]MDC9593270.1 Ig-like domain-containing protein [Xenorhabdus sp. IM139775]